MREVSVKLYSFDELSDSAKEKALKKYRDINVECIEWWDAVYDCFKEKAAKHGFYVERMRFSGFWSQGDGAMFEGSFDLDNYLDNLGVLTRNQQRLRWLNIEYSSINISHMGNYCHSNSSNFDRDLSIGWRRDHYYNLESLLPDVEELYHDLCSELYRDLEAEYEWLTSEEMVAETILINEFEFLADGSIPHYTAA